MNVMAVFSIREKYSKELVITTVLWKYGTLMADVKEDELVRSACAGDARAFRDLLDMHYDSVFRMAYHLCGHRENAEDITQMACLKIAQNISGFEGKSKFTTWIYTIVLNTFRDWNDKRANTGKGFMPLEAVEGTLSAAANPEHDVDIAQRMRYLQLLPDTEREAVLLVYAEGCSHKEAANILGCAEGTVSSRIHEARKKLAAAGGGF